MQTLIIIFIGQIGTTGWLPIHQAMRPAKSITAAETETTRRCVTENIPTSHPHPTPYAACLSEASEESLLGEEPILIPFNRVKVMNHVEVLTAQIDMQNQKRASVMPTRRHLLGRLPVMPNSFRHPFESGRCRIKLGMTTQMQDNSYW